MILIPQAGRSAEQPLLPPRIGYAWEGRREHGHVVGKAVSDPEKEQFMRVWTCDPTTGRAARG